MSKNPLSDLYEKLYFHEIHVRESLGNRLQTPMAITVSLIGVLGFLIQSFDKQQSGFIVNLFTFFLVCSAVSLIYAVYFFIKSWWGSTYAFLPSAEDTENYRKLLDSTYKEYKDGDDLAKNYLDEYLCNNYIKCATQNTQCNDLRSLNLHKTNGALILTTLLVFISFLTFFFGNLDKSNSNKPNEVIIVKPVDIKGAFMTKPEPPKVSTPPPQPPAPPPPRLIKEGVEIVRPAQDKQNGK